MLEKTNEVFFKGYGMVFDFDISIYAKTVYFYLSKCKDNKTNKCFPCHFTIAKACKCSITKVQHAIKELEAIKLIQKDNRYNNTKKGKSAQTSNEYTVYSKPHDYVEVIETQSVAEMKEVQNIIPTPSTQDTDRTTTFINYNLNDKDQSINHSLDITKEKQDSTVLQDLSAIFEQCNIKSYYKSSQNIVKSCIVNMFCNKTFSQKNNIPIEIVRERLKNINGLVIDQALSNYSIAIESGTQIHSLNLYFEKVLWNSLISANLFEYMAEVS